MNFGMGAMKKALRFRDTEHTVDSRWLSNELAFNSYIVGTIQGFFEIMIKTM